MAAANISDFVRTQYHRSFRFGRRSSDAARGARISDSYRSPGRGARGARAGAPARATPRRTYRRGSSSVIALSSFVSRCPLPRGRRPATARRTTGDTAREGAAALMSTSMAPWTYRGAGSVTLCATRARTSPSSASSGASCFWARGRAGARSADRVVASGCRRSSAGPRRPAHAHLRRGMPRRRASACGSGRNRRC